ncbi:MAG TPA: hypothetical protein VF834_13965 [Streptosporangiaceae bacterium]
MGDGLGDGLGDPDGDVLGEFEGLKLGLEAETLDGLGLWVTDGLALALWDAAGLGTGLGLWLAS